MLRRVALEEASLQVVDTRSIQAFWSGLSQADVGRRMQNVCTSVGRWLVARRTRRQTCFWLSVLARPVIVDPARSVVLGGAVRSGGLFLL